MSEENANMTKYLVTDDRGEFVVEVPKTGWKITFGYVNPAVRDDMGGGGRRGHCLRIYEGKDLRAVFGNVTGVRDLAIPLARKVERQVGTSQWSQDSTGNFSGSHDVRTETFTLEESF